MPASEPNEPPGFVQTGFAQTGFASPGFASPGFASPGFASPGFASPGFASPATGKPAADYAQARPSVPEPSRVPPPQGTDAVPPPPPPLAAAPPPPPPQAAAPSLAAGVRQDMVKKLEIEAAMHAAPEDRTLRAAYFDHLGGLAVTNTGLLTALLPEIAAPLYFRCGTPDIAVMASIFRDNALAFETRATPTRILLLGAYAGYTAVDLARRFPRAEILAVEPLAENFRLLLLNTCMFPRIATRNVAVWHNPTRLAPTQRFQADWAVRLHDEDFAEERTIEAVGVKDLLADVGWSGAEMVFCDASGAEREVFANPNAGWLTWLDVAVVSLHERVAPRATEWVNKALMAPDFTHRKLGGMELFERAVPKQALPPEPAELRLIRGEPGLTRFVLADVAPTPYGFFVFGGANCQLHPNQVGTKPARAIFMLQAEGQRQFRAGLRHGGRHAAPIVFAAAVQREDGTIAAQGAVTVRSRDTGELRFDLGGPVTGAVKVVLQTALVPEAPNANMAWAQWLEPRLI